MKLGRITARARHTHVPRLGRTALAAAALAALAACGGGDDDEPVPDSAYVTWTGSANGVVILDGNNERFSVRTDNRNVAFYDNDTILTGLTVNSSADVFSGSTRIGSVTYTTATTGARIVDFTCLDGREMDIVMSGGTWTYRCL
jgi:hypothetical protein